MTLRKLNRTRRISSLSKSVTFSIKLRFQNGEDACAHWTKSVLRNYAGNNARKKTRKLSKKKSTSQIKFTCTDWFVKNKRNEKKNVTNGNHVSGERTRRKVRRYGRLQSKRSTERLVSVMDAERRRTCNINSSVLTAAIFWTLLTVDPDNCNLRQLIKGHHALVQMSLYRMSDLLIEIPRLWLYNLATRE